MDDLIRELEEGHGADRALDQAIWCVVDVRHKPVGKDNYTFDDGQMRWRGFKPVPQLTASLDACFALEQELFRFSEHEITNLHGVTRVTVEANGPSPAYGECKFGDEPYRTCRAWLSGILKAKAMEANDE